MNRRNTSWKRRCASCGASSGTGGWFADDQAQLGDEVDHEPPVRPQRLQKHFTPARQLGLALAEERPHQALKCLDQRRIRDVAFVLVELARGEQPARRHQRLVQLVDDGGLADAGIARDQHQLRRAARDHAIESGEQGIDLARSARRVFLQSEAGPACRLRRAGSRRCGPGLPIGSGSAAGRAPGLRRSGSAPPPSWRAAS